MVQGVQIANAPPYSILIGTDEYQVTGLPEPNPHVFLFGTS